MSITSQAELAGIRKAGEAVAMTLRAMQDFARPGMSTATLDQYGAQLLQSRGARSAPASTYGFPGATCISVNQQAAHGIPSSQKIIREGDLINIDVSAEVNGFYADNGASFVVGNDIYGHNSLVNASREILKEAVQRVHGGMRIADLGEFIESAARKRGYQTIKNLVGHGIGRSLHEAPHEIPCFNDRSNTARFKKNSVVAIETFISTKARYVYEMNDGWTYASRDGSFVAQHEHTLIITDEAPIIVTEANGI